MVEYQNGSAPAAEQLVERLSPMLYRFLSHPMQRGQYTEDLLQECWLRIHRARHTYRAELPVLPWILAIARHTRVDGFRRHRRIRSREVAIEDFTENPTDKPFQRSPAASSDLHRLLTHLPESQREVLLMLKVAGMSLEEVARATSSTVGSVKQKAHRAYEKLRRLIGNASEESRK
jgi:RNA polymerase sigma-70 factor (ECF subfamily)